MSRCSMGRSVPSLSRTKSRVGSPAAWLSRTKSQVAPRPSPEIHSSKIEAVARVRHHAETIRALARSHLSVSRTGSLMWSWQAPQRSCRTTFHLFLPRYALVTPHLYPFLTQLALFCPSIYLRLGGSRHKLSVTGHARTPNSASRPRGVLIRAGHGRLVQRSAPIQRPDDRPLAHHPSVAVAEQPFGHRFTRWKPSTTSARNHTSPILRRRYRNLPR